MPTLGSHLSTDFSHPPLPSQAAGLEMEQPGHELTSVLDGSSISEGLACYTSEGLTCYATVPGSVYSNLI